ncbi:MAG: aminotransferase class I/II-fold pyridoxal phosphate-dependent enzyme [Gemmatimonadales bacterium]|jgi:cystathionine beta-lyase/cystathionine gamma-synthase|nr:aminotransferase class I/II-fold pyridoxal phosphate-dependent enzyme [Gemmatimonadales bacterium]
MTPRPGLSTLAIHGLPHRRPDWSPVVPPLVQSSTFTNPVGSHEEVLYTRYGNNPNQVEIARKYALLEGAEEALFTASGMGATALAHLAVLRPGDHLVASSLIYGGTRRLFDEEFGKFGVEITYVNPLEPRSWKKSLRRTTRAVFVETPINPTLRLVDLQPVARVAREAGVALLVDATFASPINFRPLEHGADVVITSATKYLNGHSDVIAGAVAGSAPFIEEVTRLMKLWGQSLDPHSAWLIDRGLRTLEVRMQRHNENGMAVAQWAAAHPAIARVHYPGLPAHPDHALAVQALAGFGGMVGLELAAGPAAAERMLARLQLVAHAPSLAGVESLISEPRLTSHRALGPEGRSAMGIPDGFLRLSCGLENATDIIADLTQALEG